jgi:hypothetical protein
MRVKFEATDATGKVHKGRSMSHVYSHCVVIHFAAYPPASLGEVTSRFIWYSAQRITTP